MSTANTRFLDAVRALTVATEREYRYREATRERLYREMRQSCPDCSGPDATPAEQASIQASGVACDRRVCCGGTGWLA